MTRPVVARITAQAGNLLNRLAINGLLETTHGVKFTSVRLINCDNKQDLKMVRVCKNMPSQQPPSEIAFCRRRKQ
jgi:hypothetical protein